MNSPVTFSGHPLRAAIYLRMARVKATLTPEQEGQLDSILASAVNLGFAGTVLDSHAASVASAMAGGTFLDFLKALLSDLAADLPEIIAAILALLAANPNADAGSITIPTVLVTLLEQAASALLAAELPAIQAWLAAHGIVVQRPRGAKPSARHKLARAMPFDHTQAAAPPASFGVVSPKNSFFLNDTYGDCVTAEECSNINRSSVANGGSPVIVADNTVYKWAANGGFLNGAELTDVMDALQVSANNPLVADDVNYFVGPYQSVDWTNQAALSAAIFGGQVKIGVAANQLENVVGQSNGWALTGAYRDGNINHCVGLVGYGTAAECYAILGVAVPNGVDPTLFGYLLDTWNTVGFTDHASLVAYTGEAWVRIPSSMPNGVAPAPPTPPAPTPAPVPTPTPAPAPLTFLQRLEALIERLEALL